MTHQEMEEHKMSGPNGSAIWGVQFTPFWQQVTLWAGRLNEWAQDHARRTAKYILIKGNIDDRS